MTAPKLDPPYNELWRRIELAEELACNGGGQDGDCPWCRRVIEALRGGTDFCPSCGHINSLGHSCWDWHEYDAGHITLEEVGRRWQNRDDART